MPISAYLTCEAKYSWVKEGRQNEFKKVAARVRKASRCDGQHLTWRLITDHVLAGYEHSALSEGDLHLDSFLKDQVTLSKRECRSRAGGCGTVLWDDVFKLHISTAAMDSQKLGFDE